MTISSKKLKYIHIKNRAIVVTTLVYLMGFFFLLVTGCDKQKTINSVSILRQIPDTSRIFLVPIEFVNSDVENYNIITFGDIAELQKKDGHIYDEAEFYSKAKQLGVQYIIISNVMTNNSNTQFPWMNKKNFRVCPGNIEHKSSRYFTLLVWDNSKHSYHFLKYLYEDIE